VLKQLESSFVDCIVTSPPYFWLRDYGVEGQIGLEDTVDAYVSSLVRIMSQARRVLRPEGVAFLNLGDTYYSGKGKSHGRDAKSKKRRFGLRAVDKSGGLGIGLQRKSLIGIPWRVALALAEDGWVLRSAIIWHRKNRLPEWVRDRPSRSYEHVFMLAKSRRYHFVKSELPGGEIDEGLWTIAVQPRPNGGLDTAPFPDELVTRCLDIGCPLPGVVLDPFVGSGTTVRVAVNTRRSGIGIDLNESFCRYATRTLDQIL
jgi:DNA modification methylase